jgi:hypothetical protein
MTTSAKASAKRSGKARSSVARGSASGPRLRWEAASGSQYWGSYKKHKVAVWCYNKRRIWSYVVTAPDGTKVADGIMDGPGTMREAIVHAVTGAMLWPNNTISHTEK